MAFEQLHRLLQAAQFRRFISTFEYKRLGNAILWFISVDLTRENMKPDPKNLLEIAGIKIPLIGFYDVPDSKPFELFARPKLLLISPKRL
ncbi:MAG: hypothetical protein K8R25_12515 [Methanosarcinales archaeon]|nr:hypothetical protein [Methanosarcinales archaeon]